MDIRYPRREIRTAYRVLGWTSGKVFPKVARMPLERDDVPHTPGPWHYDGLAQIVEWERPHMRIAFLPSDHLEYASSPANARLIAAAPDLLAALLAAKDFIGNGYQPPDLIDQMQAAIDKATKR